MAKQKVNPWAICHAQLGKEKTDKFERCVMKIKAKHGLKEDREYIDWFLKEGAILAETKAARKAAHSKIIKKYQKRAGGGEEALGGGKPQGDEPRQKWLAHKKNIRQEQPVTTTTSRDPAQRVRVKVGTGHKRVQPQSGGVPLHKRLAGKSRKTDSDITWKGQIGTIGASTEYEGPSLSETAAYIAGFLGEAGVGTRRAGQADPARAYPSQGKHQMAGRKEALKRIKSVTGFGGTLGQSKTPAERKEIRKKASKTYAKRVVGTHVGKHGPEPRATPAWAAKLAHVERTKHEGPTLAETKDWIQGAVNPKHKGYCTPMTKETCTPARKALAKRFKKAGRREGTKKGGKTGWKGKV